MKFIEYALSGLAIGTAIAFYVLNTDHKKNKNKQSRIYNYVPINSSNGTNSDDITIPTTTTKRRTLLLRYVMKAWGNKEYTLQIYGDDEYTLVDVSDKVNGKVITDRLNSQQQLAANYLINHFDEMLTYKSKINLQFLDGSHTYISLNNNKLDLGLNQKGVFSSNIEEHLDVLVTLLHKINT